MGKRIEIKGGKFHRYDYTKRAQEVARVSHWYEVPNINGKTDYYVIGLDKRVHKVSPPKPRASMLVEVGREAVLFQDIKNGGSVLSFKTDNDGTSGKIISLRKTG